MRAYPDERMVRLSDVSNNIWKAIAAPEPSSHTQVNQKKCAVSDDLLPICLN